MRCYTGVVVTVLAMAIAGCTAGGREPEFGKADLERIREIDHQLVQAFNTKEITKIVGLYTDTAVLMPPNSSRLRGKDSIQGYYQQLLNEDGAGDLEIESTDIGGHGNLAYASGTYRLKQRPQGGTETRDRGKYMRVLRNYGGQWRYEYVIWSSDLPKPVDTAASS